MGLVNVIILQHPFDLHDSKRDGSVGGGLFKNHLVDGCAGQRVVACFKVFRLHIGRKHPGYSLVQPIHLEVLRNVQLFEVQNALELLCALRGVLSQQ